MAEGTPLFMDIDSVYSGDELGLPYRDIIGEGVIGTALGTILKVTEHAGTPNLSVDIAAGGAWIKGDTDTNHQPTYRVYNDAVVNVGITPDASLARKVIITAKITDETFTGTGRVWAITATHGTPNASPVAPSTPDSALLLATIDVPAADTAITNSQITDNRALATVGGGNLGVSGGSGGGAIPIDLRNPGFVLGTGNCFPTVTTLNDFEEWHWEFVKDVDGYVYGVVKMPATAPTAAKIVLATIYNATSGISRWEISWASFADGASANPASLTTVTAQDITVPGTARLRKDVTFTLATQPSASDLMYVRIRHNGAHANDTVAVNSELLGAWFLPS